MATIPEIDALAGRIQKLTQIAAAADGVNTITISVGPFTMTVDPGKDGNYEQSADFVRVATQRMIEDLRSQIMAIVMA